MTADGNKDDPDMTNTPEHDTTGENNDGTSQGNPNKITSSPQQIMTSSSIAFTTDILTMDRETSSINREITTSPINSQNTFAESTLINSVKSIASITLLVSTSISSSSFGFSLGTSTAVAEDTTSSSLPGSSQSDNTGSLSSGLLSSHKNIDTSDTDMFTSYAASEQSTFSSVNFDISEDESSTSKETTRSVSVVSLSSNSKLSFTPSISDDDSSSSQLVSTNDLVVASSTPNVESDISLLSGNSNTITTQVSVEVTTSIFSPIGTAEASFKTSVSDSSSQSILSSFSNTWSLSTSESPSRNPETSSFNPNEKASFKTFDSSIQQTEASDTLTLSLDVSSNYLTTSTIDVGDASSSNQESLSPLNSPQISDSYSSENDITGSAGSLPSDTELTGSVQDETSEYATLFSPATETIGDISTTHVSSTEGQSVISVPSSVHTSSDERLRESSTYNSKSMIAATITSSELQDRTSTSDDISDTVSFPKSEQTISQTQDESIISISTSFLTTDRKASTISDTTFPSSSTPESDVISRTTDTYNITSSTLSDVGGSNIILFSSSTNLPSSNTETTTEDTMAFPSTDDNTVTISFSSDFNGTSVMLFSSPFSVTTDFQSVVVLTTATFNNFDTLTLSTATENGSPIVGLSSSVESSNTIETLSAATIPNDDNVTNIFSNVTDEANNSMLFSFSTTENDSTIITTSPNVFVNGTTTMSPQTTIDSNDTDNTFFATEENDSTITVFPSATQINDNDTLTFFATGSVDDNTSMISPMTETHSYNITINSEIDDTSSNVILSFMTAVSYHSTMASSDNGNFTFPLTFDSDDGMMLFTTDEIENNLILSTTVTDNNTAIIGPTVNSSYNYEKINSDSSEDISVSAMDYSATDSYSDTADHNETDSVAFPFTRTANDNDITTLFPSETYFESNTYSDMASTTTEGNNISTLLPSTTNYYGNTTITPTATNTEGNITFITSVTTVTEDSNKTFSDFQKETNNTASLSDLLSYDSTIVDSLVDDNNTHDSNTTGSSSLTHTLNSSYTTLEFLTDADNTNFGIDSLSPIDTQIRNNIESSSPTDIDGENSTDISGSDSDTLTISNIISVVSTKVDTKSSADSNDSVNIFPSSTEDFSGRF